MNLWIVIAFLLIGFAAWELAYFFHYMSRLKKLRRKAALRKAELGSGKDFRLLIAGDSIGTGMGASSFEKSVAGRIAHHISGKHHVIMRNMSINGSKVKTLLANKINERYELCVLLISSNDVIRFTPFINFEKDLQKMLEKYAKISKKVILIGPANVGDAYLLPALLRIIYRRTAPKYAAILKKISSKFPSVSYINSISPRKELGEYTRKYYGTDMFHPNDDGHEFWFEMIKEKL